ncbi:hypothetical protein [Deinococcus altitudinis]|uniref:DUF7694 domain-containing protein n=1 Tax=Deinococcus altitudinis TaxID=468914 RepID=UPI003892421F
MTIVVTAKEDYDQLGVWRHVSAAAGQRYPTFEELVVVRAQFFPGPEQVVHVIPSEIKNSHPLANCLHLWQRQDAPSLPGELMN